MRGAKAVLRCEKSVHEAIKSATPESDFVLQSEIRKFKEVDETSVLKII